LNGALEGVGLDEKGEDAQEGSGKGKGKEVEGSTS
jgi:hypothetical protein